MKTDNPGALRETHGQLNLTWNLTCGFDLVGVTGLEPVTPGPPDRCATNCATPRIEQETGSEANGTRMARSEILPQGF